jgi:hypothetical protein
LTGSGDTGAATYKWSHDGGATYLGRDNPDQGSWLAERTVDSNVDNSANTFIRQLSNGNLIGISTDGASGNLNAVFSTDNGNTFSGEVTINDTTGLFASTVIVQESGRVYILSSSKHVHYSDDNGATWTILSTSGLTSATVNHAIEISPNLIVATESTTNSVSIVKSVDGGFNFSGKTTVANDANFQLNPTIAEAANGNLVCAYATDEDSVNDFEIKCKISSDGGATWGSAIDVIDYTANDFNFPDIITDKDGVLYCAAREDSADQTIVLVTSTDNGETWNSSTPKDLYTVVAVDLSFPHLAIIDNPEIVCAYVNTTNSDFEFVRRGMWETYSANDVTVPVNASNQQLCCSVELAWRGYSGITGDIWTFASEYQYAMENTIDQLGPSKPWRSENDNTAQTILLDAGANNVFNVTGAAFYGCNLRTLDFQMNATDSWGSPSVDEEISFDIAQGNAIATNDGNTFQTTLSQLGTEFGGDEVTNGGFDSAVTSWSANFCTAASIAGGQSGNCAEITRVSGTVQYISQVISGLTVGSHYRMSAYVKTGSSGDGAFSIRVTPISPLTDIAKYEGTSTSEWVQYDIAFVATHTSHIIYLEKANSDAGTMLFDTATMYEVLPYDLRDHALVNKYIRFMPGASESGNTFKIKDNVSDIIILDTTSSVTIGSNDQFFIYSNKSSKTFTGGVYRYIQISIDAQQTAEDYYQIGSMIAGMATTLSRGWRNGYNKDNSYNIKIQRTIAGVPIAQKYNDKKFMFSLRWTASETTREEVISTIDYLSGDNFALIPDNDTLTDCYLVKHIGSSISQSHAVNDRFNIGPVRLEEII